VIAENSDAKRNSAASSMTRQAAVEYDRDSAGGDSVELRIEELVLHGFAPGDRYRIGDAVQRELARLLQAHVFPGTLQDQVALDRINTGTVRLNRDMRPEGIGCQTAHTILSGIGGMDKGR